MEEIIRLTKEIILIFNIYCVIFVICYIFILFELKKIKDILEFKNYEQITKHHT